MSQIRPALLKRSDVLSRFKTFENIPGFKRIFASANTGRSAFNYIERQKAFTGATEELGKINQADQRALSFRRTLHQREHDPRR